jgi:RNA polymerase sigma factor (TIGR02999 family)
VSTLVLACAAIALCLPLRWFPGEAMSAPPPLTEWLRAAGTGDAEAGNRAYGLVYAELRRLAARQLRRKDATLTPTALVNETFLKLSGATLASLDDRRHFFNLAARAMRQTLIDHARDRLAHKRGGAFVRTELDERIPDLSLDAQQILGIEQALHALDVQDPDLAELFGWHVFAGLDTQQIAEMRGVNRRTVQRDLDLARSYLRLALDAAG